MIEQLRNQLEVASGRSKASLVFKNVNIVNVFTNDIQVADVAVQDGYIVGVGHYDGAEEIDLRGKYLCPGFIDGHIHLESSMVSPQEFEKAVMPHGTTTVITDPHEITNVAGGQGLHYMLEAAKDMLLDVYLMMPSCVPATELDESGAVLDAEEILPYYDHPQVLGLAEVMDAYGVIQGKTEILKKISDVRKLGKRIDGHAPFLSGKGLNAYVCAGILSDHECSAASEAIEKLSLGQWIMIREGTAAKNLEALMPLCEEKYYQRCMFVTDDKHPGDLIRYGHIDYIIKKAVRLGADPVRAIKMGSFNTAQYFGFKDRGAVAPGYRADLVVLEDLADFKIIDVFKSGKAVRFSERREAVKERKLPGYERVMDSFQMKEITAADLQINAAGSHERVIELIPRELLTKELIIPKIEQPGYPPGVNPEQDIVKAAVFERHSNTGHIGIGFIKGYGIKKGAIASSVAHDSHNLIIIGTNDRDIMLAGNCVRKNRGGLAVVIEGAVAGELPLPIAGLMSDMPVEQVEEQLKFLKKLCGEIGIAKDIDPFMTLAFISLSVIPSLRLSTYGLINVETQQIVSAFSG